MCWNKETSLSSFIIGTCINIFCLKYFKNYNTIIFIVWQWVLMMQLSEYLIWIDQDCKTTNNYGSKMALLFNITQPIITYICLILTSTNETKYKYIASTLLLVYISFFIVKLNSVTEYKCIKPIDKCHNLNLKWWTDIKYSGIIYTIILSSIVLLLYSPLKYSVFIVSYVLLTQLISMIFYSCGSPSMWCLIVVPFPIIYSLICRKF